MSTSVTSVMPTTPRFAGAFGIASRNPASPLLFGSRVKVTCTARQWTASGTATTCQTRILQTGPMCNPGPASRQYASRETS